MTTRSTNIGRVFEAGQSPVLNDYPVIAADIIYEGSAIGESASLGYVRPHVSGDVFCGFAMGKADNSSGAAGDVNVRAIQQGVVKLTVTGGAVATLNALVYASDDDTFTTTAGAHTAIGKIVRHVSGSVVMVAFQAEALQSV